MADLPTSATASREAREQSLLLLKTGKLPPEVVAAVTEKVWTMMMHDLRIERERTRMYMRRPLINTIGCRRR